jgi:phosphoribosylanthranilate isomerase
MLTFSMRIRVKICGITRIEDALSAASAGADAIGLVFYAPSPRAVTTEIARQILQEIPAFVTTVGLFVDADASEVNRVLEQVELDCLQFHGNESADYCRQFGKPYIKAVRVQQDTNLDAIAQSHAEARALLLDTYVEHIAGGTGQSFDWQLVPEQCSKPIILAGGLGVDNVAEAITKTHPYAVDVSGGVEARKGIKDHEKIIAFIKEVNRVGTS